MYEEARTINFFMTKTRFTRGRYAAFQDIWITNIAVEVSVVCKENNIAHLVEVLPQW